MTDATAVPLAYDTRQRRGMATWRDLPGLARLFFEGAVIAALVAAPVFISLLSAPTLVTLALGLGQGFIVGMMLRSLFRRARVRQKSIALVVSLASGALSALLVYVGLYARQAYYFHAQQSGTFVLKNLVAVFGFGGVHPYQLLSSITTRTTGHGGFLGYILLRIRSSPSFSKLLVGHALFTSFFSWRSARRQIAAPFCSACAEWLGAAKNAAVVPTWLLGEIIAAIRDNDLARAVDATRQAANSDLSAGCAVTRIRSCPACQGVFAEVVVKTLTATGYGVKSREGMQLQATHVTPELLQALRSEPVIAAAEGSFPPPVPS